MKVCQNQNTQLQYGINFQEQRNKRRHLRSNSADTEIHSSKNESIHPWVHSSLNDFHLFILPCRECNDWKAWKHKAGEEKGAVWAARHCLPACVLSFAICGIDSFSRVLALKQLARDSQPWGVARACRLESWGSSCWVSLLCSWLCLRSFPWSLLPQPSPRRSYGRICGMAWCYRPVSLIDPATILFCFLWREWSRA